VKFPTGGEAALGRQARERKLNWFESSADGTVRMGEAQDSLCCYFSLCPCSG